MNDTRLLVLIPRGADAVQVDFFASLKALSSGVSLGGGVTVIGLPQRDREGLRGDKRFFFEEDFEAAPYLEGVNEDAFKTAAAWYCSPEVHGLLQVSGAPVGALIQHPFTYFLLSFLRDEALLRGIFETGRVQKVLVYRKGVLEEVELPDRSACLNLLWPPEREEPAPPSFLPGEKKAAEAALRFLWGIASLFFETVLFFRRRRVFICSDLKHCETVIPYLFKNSAVRLTLLRQKAGIRFWKFAGRYLMGINFLNLPSGMPADESLWARLDGALSQSSIFTRHGLNLWPCMRPSFRTRFFSRFQALGALYTQALIFFQKKNTAAVLFDEDVTPYNKTLALAAAKLEIPSLVIQHGAPFRTVPIALAPVTASRIAAWGPYSRELLQSWGVPDFKISLTGVPRYDGFETALTREESARQKVRRDLAAAPDQKLVVLATDPFHEDDRADFVGHYLSRESTRRLLETVFKTMESFKDVCLVVKLHPRDPHEDYTRQRILCSALKDRVKLLRLYSTPNLLLACDILITPCSTVAIEAMMLRKPVITVNLEGGPDLQPHAETGAAIGAGNLESLSSAIGKLLYDSRFRDEQIERSLEVIPKYLTRPLGGASLRVAQELLDLIHAEPREKT